MVWDSRRKRTSPSRRSLARCCDRADWLSPRASTKAPTGISPRVARKHRMTSRFSFARSFNSRAASYAQSTITPISANSDALQPGASTGPDGVSSTDMVIFRWLLRLEPFPQVERDTAIDTLAFANLAVADICATTTSQENGSHVVLVGLHAVVE